MPGARSAGGLFADLHPRAQLWVDASAQPGGDGSNRRPFLTIGEAVAHVTPGTAIMVRKGEYVENVLFARRLSGTRDAPIWLLSADGPQAAHVIAALPGKPAIGGGGNSNIVVAGFRVTGGRNGIQFSQNGFDYSKPIANIVIRSNLIENAVQDGIKANGGEHVYATNNRIVGGTDEGIDFLGIVHGEISDNDVSGIRSPTGGISVKGGVAHVRIARNHVHDIRSDGILVGGWVGPKIVYKAGYDSFEVSRVTVEDNRIERVGKRPINAMGAQHCIIRGNYLEATRGYHTVISVTRNAPFSPRPFNSADLSIRGNTISRADRQIQATPDSVRIDFRDNRVGSDWTRTVGPDLGRYSAADPLN